MQVDNHRKSGLDLLRLVCMLMVITLHYFGAGGLLASNQTSKINYYIGSFFVVFCRIAVDCFYLNSGYFLKPSENRNIIEEKVKKGILKIYSKAWSYSVLITIICLILGISDFSLSVILRAFFPVIFNQYWFITVFILLQGVRPFIEKLLFNLDKTDLRILCGILLFFDCFACAFGNNSLLEYGNGFLHGITMILVGFSLNYIPSNKYRKSVLTIVYIAFCVATRLSSLVITYLGVDINYSSTFMVYNSPLIIIASIAFFLIFRDVRCNIKWVTKVSPHVLAIYLLNDHSLMRIYWWEKVFRCGNYYNSPFMIFHCLFSVMIFAAVGLLVDYVFTNTSLMVKNKLGGIK